MYVSSYVCVYVHMQVYMHKGPQSQFEISGMAIATLQVGTSEETPAHKPGELREHWWMCVSSLSGQTIPWSTILVCLENLREQAGLFACMFRIWKVNGNGA